MRALEITVDQPLYRRRALWSLGWSAFNRGEPGRAMAFWQQADEQHGGRPFWVPYSMAVAAWTAGDRALALDWYAAAARSHADWRHAEGMRARTLRWKATERVAIEEIFADWFERNTAPVVKPEA